MFPFNKVIIGCWIVFWIGWLIAAFGSKRNISSPIRRFMGVRLVIFIILVIVFRSWNVQNYSLENRVVSSNEGILFIGLIIFIAGLLLAIWARVYLGKNWGMPMSLKKDPELVTLGPYKYIRHPIYTGILTAMLGAAIAGSVFWLIIFAIAGAYFIYCAVQEEKIMLKEFPKDYPKYKSTTKMLIPFVL